MLSVWQGLSCFIPENHQGWVISTSPLFLVRLLSFSWKITIINVHKGIADLSTSELWEPFPMGNGHLEAGALAQPYRQAGFNCKPLHQRASVNCCKCLRGGLEQRAIIAGTVRSCIFFSQLESWIWLFLKEITNSQLIFS